MKLIRSVIPNLAALGAQPSIVLGDPGNGETRVLPPFVTPPDVFVTGEGLHKFEISSDCIPEQITNKVPAWVPYLMGSSSTSEPAPESDTECKDGMSEPMLEASESVSETDLSDGILEGVLDDSPKCSSSESEETYSKSVLDTSIKSGSPTVALTASTAALHQAIKSNHSLRNSDFNIEDGVPNGKHSTSAFFNFKAGGVSGLSAEQDARAINNIGIKSQSFHASPCIPCPKLKLGVLEGDPPKPGLKIGKYKNSLEVALWNKDNDATAPPPPAPTPAPPLAWPYPPDSASTLWFGLECMGASSSLDFCWKRIACRQAADGWQIGRGQTVNEQWTSSGWSAGEITVQLKFIVSVFIPA
ncbi:hypothetical protein DFH08DRAFT_818749 [Mycena albidolilacea]|uniref:Uncharacterized protein n=1 Tax=Mycena albidolilacea TaxID=1033008 RepID=A0AAD6ZG50_9AGAR|nr:hypothetical protein DFH08DRAFT_818749 [Mycena albidolilacea]